MELYECNYIRLRNLVPQPGDLPAAAISRVAGALDLHLHIVELCRFTTTLNLTYHFTDKAGTFPAPDMQVRVYHDAQVGEVIACGRRRGIRHAEYNRMQHSYTLEQKWHMNRFLQKWLGYCLLQGHRFLPDRVIVPRADASPQCAEDSVLIAES
jgi:hypothetical protein